jgi:hypothetical protein
MTDLAVRDAIKTINMSHPEFNLNVAGDDR